MELLRLKIDPEFKALIPKLRKAEYLQLESNIMTDGCRNSTTFVLTNLNKQFILNLVSVKINSAKGCAMFIGREKELAIIKKALSKNTASVMVYGKRKIGKTTLITHALKKDANKTVYYECLKAPMKDNVDGLISVLLAAKVLPVRMSFDNFIDLFAYLNTCLLYTSDAADE